MTATMASLLRDLHAAGWQYSVESEYRGGRDADGAPYTDDETRIR